METKFNSPRFGKNMHFIYYYFFYYLILLIVSFISYIMVLFPYDIKKKMLRYIIWYEKRKISFSEYYRHNLIKLILYKLKGLRNKWKQVTETIENNWKTLWHDD